MSRIEGEPSLIYARPDVVHNNFYAFYPPQFRGSALFFDIFIIGVFAIWFFSR